MRIFTNVIANFCYITNTDRRGKWLILIKQVIYFDSGMYDSDVDLRTTSQLPKV